MKERIIAHESITGWRGCANTKKRRYGLAAHNASLPFEASLKSSRQSNSDFAGFPCANPDGFHHVVDKNFPVAYLTGLCTTDDGINDSFDILIVDDNLEFDLRQKIHPIFFPAPLLGEPFLLTVSLNLGKHDPGITGTLKGVPNSFKLFGTNNGFYLFHVSTSSRTLELTCPEFEAGPP